VTLLFAMAQSNGTLGQLTHHAVRLCRGNAGTIPVMFFLLGAALASMGPGNIATAALLTPIAMATATRAGIPLFLMAIMVGNGANSGALSPFAPTGIIVNGIMAKNQLPGLEMQAYLYNLGAHALMAFGGYALFGGLKLFARERTVEVVDPEGQKAFTTKQWITLGVIAALILSVIAFKAQVGLAAFLAAVLLVATGAADDAEAIKLMPWRVIVMVCGVTVLIALVERFQGIDLMVSLVARIANPRTVTFIVALLTGIVSVYSSTSGVVLPAFLPLVPGLAAQLPGAERGGHRDVHEHRWTSGGRLAALDDWRLVHRERGRHGHAQAVQSAAGLGALDGSCRRDPLLRAVLGGSEGPRVRRFEGSTDPDFRPRTFEPPDPSDRRTFAVLRWRRALPPTVLSACCHSCRRAIGIDADQDDPCGLEISGAGGRQASAEFLAQGHSGQADGSAGGTRTAGRSRTSRSIWNHRSRAGENVLDSCAGNSERRMQRRPLSPVPR
jgi:hypothetical protein